MSLFKKRKTVNIRQRRIGGGDISSEDEAPIIIHKSTNGKSSNIEKKKKDDKGQKMKKLNTLSFGDDLEADDGIVFQEKKSILSYKLKKEMKMEKKKKTKDKGIEKPPDTVSELDQLGIRIVNGRAAEVIAMQPGDSDEEGPIFSSAKKPPSHKLKDALKGGSIPDANLIHEIRKQRQKARELGDIPAEEIVPPDEAKSRLIREDDNDHSDEDEGMIKFSVNQEETERKMRREAFESVQAEKNNESEHDSDWELQQLKKAGASRKIADQEAEDMQIEDVTNGYNMAPVHTVYSSSVDASQECSAVQATGLLPTPSNYDAEGIRKRFHDSYLGVTEVVERHRKEADDIIDELVNSKATITSCSTNNFTDSYQFYQDMRGYVSDLRECLNEKMSDIKIMEEKISLVRRQRRYRLVQRRRQDIKDQNNECSPFAGKGSKQDEYQIRRASEREGRRTRRRRERERKGDITHHDGMSTDDEEAVSEVQTIRNELHTIRGDQEKLFEDVEDDFAMIGYVLQRFSEWKKVDPDSYTDAYVTFNLPKIVSSFIRLELAFWNPLSKEENCVEVERMEWYSILAGYGASTDETFESLKNNSDKNFLSNVIEKVVLPKLKDIVSTSWDQLSHTQSVKLVNLFRHYTSAYPSIAANSKQLKELTSAIIAKIKDSIENDVFIPMFPKNIYESRTSNVSLFFQRQFWSAWKLFGCVLMWHRILSDNVIHELAIRSLLNLYILPSLNLASDINVQDALVKTKNVMNVLPREWCKTNGEVHLFLERLEVFLVTLSTKLDPSNDLYQIREICNLLKSLGSNKYISITKKYL